MMMLENNELTAGVSLAPPKRPMTNLLGAVAVHPPAAQVFDPMEVHVAVSYTVPAPPTAVSICNATAYQVLEEMVARVAVVTDPPKHSSCKVPL